MSEISKKTKSKKKKKELSVISDNLYQIQISEEEKAKQAAMEKRKLKALKEAYKDIKEKYDKISEENKKLNEKVQKHEKDLNEKT